MWGSPKLVTSTGSLTPRRVILKATEALRRISCRYMQMIVQMPASSNTPSWSEGFANFIEDAAFQFQEKLKSFPVPITVSWYRQQNTLMCTQHSVLYICDLLSEFSNSVAEESLKTGTLLSEDVTLEGRAGFALCFCNFAEG